MKRIEYMIEHLREKEMEMIKLNHARNKGHLKLQGEEKTI